MIKSIFLFAFFLTSFLLQAQEGTIPLQFSFKEGTFIYVSDQAISRTSPLEGITSIRISRDNGRGFKELARAAFLAAFPARPPRAACRRLHLEGGAIDGGRVGGGPAHGANGFTD